MKRFLAPILLLLALGFAASPIRAAAINEPGGASGSARILAIVGPDTLKVSDLDAELAAAVAAAKGKELPAIDSDGLLKRLIQDRLLEQEGYRIGEDKDQTVQNQVHELVRTKAVRALMDSISAPPPGSAGDAGGILPGMIIQLRRYSHILVKNEATARSLRDSLTRGVPFADLARRHSTDDTAAKGGDLDWASQGAYVPEFEKAAAPLRLHEITPPVKTAFGWHLITLTDSRNDTLKSKDMVQGMRDDKERERRTQAIRSYIATLRMKYHVTVNDSLLATLDYGSKDPKVVKNLETSEAVLALVPSGNLTVRRLTRNIMFQYYHGLGGRKDAADVRNQMFDEWVTESLLSHEARLLGFEEKPAMRAAARWDERYLLREQVIQNIISFDFKPQEKEIAAYYKAHQKDFIPKPRVKVQSARSHTIDFAQQLLNRMKQGAGLKWLCSQYPDSVAGEPPLPADWIPPEAVGLVGKSPVIGSFIGPNHVTDGWAVGVVTAVESVSIPPLAQCREAVVKAMRGAQTRKTVEDALARLRAATEVTIADSASAIITSRLAYFRGIAKQGGTP